MICIIIQVNRKVINDRDRNICKFNEKWERANKYFDAAIEYLKDAFLLVSYMKLEYLDYLKMKKDDTARSEKLRKIADYLDELLSRNIRNFILNYYMLDEKSICKAEYIVPKCDEYHYQHAKYFGMNDIESYVKEHLFNNLYTQLNIFNYELREEIDGFHNYEISNDMNKIIEREENFIKWK